MFKITKKFSGSILFTTYYRGVCLSTPLLRKANSSKSQVQILRESEALNLLASSISVRVQFSSDLPKHLIESFSATSECPFHVQSSLLKSLMRRENVTMTVLRHSGEAPLVFVEPNPCSSSSNSSVSTKLLKLRTNIDDHMMRVKVKQATELINRGHEVSINVRLPNHQFKLINDSSVLSEEQNLALKRRLYESSIKRFTDAFKDCSSKKPKLTQSNDFREFTLVLSPGH